MALPLKTGADLYNQQLIRARLQNLGAQPNTADVGLGQVYFNTGTNTAASLRIGYCYETGSVPKFHHVANLEDINRLDELISALSGSSSESVASVLGRVITLEGYFSNGKAKDADLLDGHNSDYFATASGLSALQEKVSAFLDGEADSDAVLENLKEIQAFLDSYDGATSLADMFGAVNTQIADRYTKAEADARYLKLTGGELTGQLKINAPNWAQQLILDTTSNSSGIRFNVNGSLSGVLRSTGGSLQWYVKDGEDYILLHGGNYSNLITDLNNNLNVPSITIGGIKLSVVDGQLQIDGDAFATGQLSSGGIGSEGSGSGASGIVILEDWEKYDDTLAQVLGAGLGVGLRDKIAALESKATNVSVAQTLTSGKEIGAITIDGVATKLFAPDDYLPLSGGTLNGSLGMTSAEIPDGAVGLWGTGSLYLKASDKVSFYNSSTGAFNEILHEGNYASVLDNAYLKLSGGTLTDSVMVNHSSGSKGYLLLTNGALIGGFVTNGTAVELFNVNGYGIGVEGTSDVYVLTDWAKKTMLHAGNYENIVGNKFLKLSGGEITGSLAVGRTDSSTPLYVINSFTPYTAIAFRGSTLKSAYLIYSGTGDTWEVTNEGWSRTSVLLHANNFNTYALPITGGTLTGNLNLKSAHTRYYKSDDTFIGAYNVDTTGKPIFLPMGASDWKTLAFTDSNVASATKLQTPRTIWGQSFDGTADVDGKIYQNGKWVFGLHADNNLFIGYDSKDTGSTQIFGKSIEFYNSIGDLSMLINAAGCVLIGKTKSTGETLQVNGEITVPNNSYYKVTNTSGATLGFAKLTNSNVLSLGYETAYYTGYDTALYGKEITLIYGTGNSTYRGFTLNSHGNVTIGNSDLAGADYRLYVNAGRVCFASVAGEAPTLGTMSNMAVAVGLTEYGMQSYVLGNGSAHIQVGRFDGTAAAYSLCLNPLGGNVGIGTLYPEAKLHVIGSIRLTGELAFMGGYSIQSYNSTPLSINKQGNNVLLCELGAGSVGIGTTDPRYKLDVIGNVNISSRLLVGGASDDGTNALQVHGDIALRRGASSAIGAPYDKNNPTIYNRIIFDGATYGIRYYSGGWTSSVVDSHTFYVGLNNDAALIIKNNKDVHISGNLIVDGQVSSGGVAEAGTGGAVGGSGLDRLVFEIPANTTSFPCEHGLGTRDISVSIYEDGNDFQQVLADVYLDSTNVARIVFGSATGVAHKVVIIG